jgi:glycosyltransferase involved in cell wall biosynthesis
MAGTRVVVPFYNEARRLQPARFAAFLAAFPDVGLVLVDDGSTDETRSLLERFVAEHPGRAELVGLPVNRRKGEAVRLGVQRALESAPEFFGYWDADLSAPLELLPELLAPFGERPELEIVTGARVQLLGREIERSALRHYVGRIGATAIATSLGLRVYDTQCGAKLFRATPATRALFAEPFLARWLFDVEILARLARARGAAGAARAVYEQPLSCWRDVPGSKLRPFDYLAAARDLWRIRRSG